MHGPLNVKFMEVLKDRRGSKRKTLKSFERTETVHQSTKCVTFRKTTFRKTVLRTFSIVS